MQALQFTTVLTVYLSLNANIIVRKRIIQIEEFKIDLKINVKTLKLPYWYFAGLRVRVGIANNINHEIRDL